MLAVTAGLVACQKPTSLREDRDTSTAAAGHVLKTGKLRAVVIGNQLPFTTKTPEGFDGLSFVVLEAIRDQLKTQVAKPSDSIEIEAIEASSIQDGLNRILNGSADIACGVAFTWERQKTLTFTLPFATSGIRLLTSQGNDGTPKSLNGQTIGVVKDSLAASVLAKSVDDAKLQPFDSPAEALAALKAGTVKSLGGDTLWLKANQQATAPNTALVPAYAYGRAGVGCVVADTTPQLLNVSNLAIGRLLQAYVNNNKDVRSEINSWVGPDSTIGLKDEEISTFFRIVLATVAEFTPGN